MKQFFGFTEDKVFGKIMSNKGYCKLILQSVLANFDIKIKDIEYLENQKTISNPDSSKDVRLDVLVKDVKGKLFNVEMQMANNHKLGERMRYYQSSIDRYVLDEGKTYNEISESFVIFLCMFDYFHKNKMLYSFHLYEDNHKDIMLENKSHHIVVNAFGSTENQSNDMVALTDWMNQKTISENENFKRIEKEIKRINDNPKEWGAIMDYETRLKAERQDGVQEGIQEGRQIGTEYTVQNLLGYYHDQCIDIDTVKNTIKAAVPDLPQEKIDEMIKKYYN